MLQLVSRHVIVNQEIGSSVLSSIPTSFYIVGMAHQNVCKQGRDDTIIAKVNLQSPIPTLQLQTNVKMMQ